MNITIKGKKYVASPLVMSKTREALKIFADWTAALEKSKALQDKTADDIEKLKDLAEVMEQTANLQERKCELIVRVYDNQFTLDALEDSITSAQMEAEFMKIIRNVNGEIEKNA